MNHEYEATLVRKVALQVKQNAKYIETSHRYDLIQTIPDQLNHAYDLRISFAQQSSQPVIQARIYDDIQNTDDSALDASCY